VIYPWRHWGPDIIGAGTHVAECTVCGEEITRWRPTSGKGEAPTGKHRKLIDDHVASHEPPMTLL
jgi:hypothetical protein